MGALDGLKVIDLTSMVSGPVAAMMLADQGARVIKVEPLMGEQMLRPDFTVPVVQIHVAEGQGEARRRRGVPQAAALWRQGKWLTSGWCPLNLP